MLEGVVVGVVVVDGVVGVGVVVVGVVVGVGVVVVVVGCVSRINSIPKADGVIVDPFIGGIINHSFWEGSW